MSIEWQRGQTYNVVIYKQVSNEDIPFPCLIFKKFVCIDNNGYGCASEGAWNVQASPKKHPKTEVWVNPMNYLSNGFHMKLIEKEDDVDFYIKMLEAATFDGNKVQFRDP